MAKQKKESMKLSHYASIIIKRVELIKKQRILEVKRKNLNRMIQANKKELTGLDSMLVSEYDAK